MFAVGVVAGMFCEALRSATRKGNESKSFQFSLVLI